MSMIFKALQSFRLLFFGLFSYAWQVSCQMTKEVHNDNKNKQLRSNILVIPSTEHFPLFKNAPLEWISLIEAMKSEIKSIISTDSSLKSQANSTKDAPNNANNQTLVEYLLSVLSHVPTEIHSTSLPSFKRLLLHFEDLTYLPIVARWLKNFGVYCWVGWKHVTLPHKATANNSVLGNTNNHAIEPERYIEAANEANDIDGDLRILIPPRRPIQMQSPPASPYLGWIEREEDSPDLITVTNPKSLKAVLFDENGDPVFSTDNEEEDFDKDFILGEGIDDKADETITQNSIIIETEDTLTFSKVPNIIVNLVEAESLRQIAREYEQNLSD